MYNFAKGTELLNLTDQEYRIEISKEIKGLEFNLPTIYKVFIENYIVGRSKFKEFKYLDKRYNEKLDFLDMSFRPKKDDIAVYALLSLKEIIRIMNNESGNFDFDEIDFNKVIPIGECHGQRLLFVGIDSQNLDRIFIEDLLSENKMSKLSENIFDFVSDIELFYEDSINGFSSELYYKRLTENFWRIKE
ncbi:hypothetical protein [Lacinutrix algicola]|uniref:hypothetical protein n=1 Tax=Lacinutrix algicola TaxID=342954 RepID=UPI0006E1CD48|nr:hypothetical protein [Lacinutrix algicola]